MTTVILPFDNSAEIPSRLWRCETPSNILPRRLSNRRCWRRARRQPRRIEQHAARCSRLCRQRPCDGERRQHSRFGERRRGEWDVRCLYDRGMPATASDAGQRRRPATAASDAADATNRFETYGRCPGPLFMSNPRSSIPSSSSGPGSVRACASASPTSAHTASRAAPQRPPQLRALRHPGEPRTHVRGVRPVP